MAGWQAYNSKRTIGGSSKGMNLSYYSDGSMDLDVTLVLRNGNLYIQTNGKKTEVVDDDSAIELIDDHYHALSKEEAERNNFDYTKLDTGLKRLRYHSIYNIFNLFRRFCLSKKWRPYRAHELRLRLVKIAGRVARHANKTVFNSGG